MSSSSVLLGFVAATTLLFGLWGWGVRAVTLSLDTGDVLYRALAPLLVSDLRHKSTDWNHDWRLA